MENVQFSAEQLDEISRQNRKMRSKKLKGMLFLVVAALIGHGGGVELAFAFVCGGLFIILGE